MRLIAPSNSDHPNQTSSCERTSIFGGNAELIFCFAIRESAMRLSCRHHNDLLSKAKPPRLEHRFKNNFARHLRLPRAPVRERYWDLNDPKAFSLGAKNGFDLKRVAF